MNVPLTPLRFLDRARVQFGDKIGVIDGDSRWTYRQYADGIVRGNWLESARCAL